MIFGKCNNALVMVDLTAFVRAAAFFSSLEPALVDNPEARAPVERYGVSMKVIICVYVLLREGEKGTFCRYRAV